VAAPRKAPADHLAKTMYQAKPEPVDPESFVEIKSGSIARSETTLFAIDGHHYTISTPVPAGFTLRALEMMAEESEAAAMMWLLKELIGKVAFDALANHPDVTTEHLKAILDRLQVLTIGAMEDAGKG
jgi:hypothetical protein